MEIEYGSLPIAFGAMNLQIWVRHLNDMLGFRVFTKREVPRMIDLVKKGRSINPNP